MVLNSVEFAARPVGLGAQIAEFLRIAILEGEFKGGDQLVEQGPAGQVRSEPFPAA